MFRLIDELVEFDGDSIRVDGAKALQMESSPKFIQEYWEGFEAGFAAGFEATAHTKLSGSMVGSAKWFAADILCRLTSEQVVTVTRGEVLHALGL